MISFMIKIKKLGVRIKEIRSRLKAINCGTRQMMISPMRLTLPSSKLVLSFVNVLTKSILVVVFSLSLL